jgi:hypothetical protein
MYEIYRLSTMNEGNGMDKEAAIKRMIGAAVFLSLVACSGEENSDASDPSISWMHWIARKILRR